MRLQCIECDLIKVGMNIYFGLVCVFQRPGTLFTLSQGLQVSSKTNKVIHLNKYNRFSFIADEIAVIKNNFAAT